MSNVERIIEGSQIFSGSVIEQVTGSLDFDGAVSASAFDGNLTGSVLGTSSFAVTATIADTAVTATVADSAVLIIPVPLFMERLQIIDVPEPITELEDPASRTVQALDFTHFAFSRLSISVKKKSAVGPGRPRIAVQYSTDGGTTFDFLDGVDGPYVDISGSTTDPTRVNGPNVTHVSESRTVVELRLVVYSGSATPPFESPTVQGLLWPLFPGAF